MGNSCTRLSTSLVCSRAYDILAVGDHSWQEASGGCGQMMRGDGERSRRERWSKRAAQAAGAGREEAADQRPFESRERGRRLVSLGREGEKAASEARWRTPGNETEVTAADGAVIVGARAAVARVVPTKGSGTRCTAAYDGRRASGNQADSRCDSVAVARSAVSLARRVLILTPKWRATGVRSLRFHDDESATASARAWGSLLGGSF